MSRDAEDAARHVEAALRAVHRESGRIVAARVVVAATFVRRLVGWIGRLPAPDEGLWLPQCECIHTTGLRIAIDLIWCGSGGAILRVDRSIRPCRVVMVRHATSVCEVSAGGAVGLLPGDHLDLVAISRCAPVLLS